MSIEVAREPKKFGPPFEDCCFCGLPTTFWVFPITTESVACCVRCAWRHSPHELPTKAEWCAREAEPRG